VDYDQMIHDAWEGTQVSRHTVAVTIAEVKRALGDYGSWITHRPKTGYRMEIPGGEELIREGWHFWSRFTREGLEKAADCFQRAAALDSTDHRAHEGRAASYLSLATYGMRPPRQLYPMFLEAHRQAVELCGMTPELRGSRGHGLLVFERNFDEAEKEMERALREKPKFAGIYVRLTMLYATEGRFQEALNLTAKAHEVDSLNATMPPAEIFIRLCQRDYEKARIVGERALELFPYHPLGRALFAEALFLSGRREESVRQYHLAHVMCPDLPWLRVLEGVCLAGIGKAKEAFDILEEIQKLRESDYREPDYREPDYREPDYREPDYREPDYVDAYFLALLYHALGRTEEAFHELERAVEENSATLFLLDVDVRMDPLRADPRFAALREKAFHPHQVAAC
jgi:tetratricopeptide (TPR) repeat protein